MPRKQPLTQGRPNAGTGRRPRARASTRVGLLLCLLAIASPLAAGLAAAQTDGGGRVVGECRRDGFNVECNAFGAIRMEAMKNMNGEPANVTASMVIHDSFEDREARWIMFSVRNVTANGDSPVSINLTGFESDSGDIVTTRVIQEKPSEVNLWVDVLDLPVNELVTIDAQVGVTERGAFAVETVVIPFDRGYEPITNSDGEPVSLFSSTLLAVNQETVSTTSGSQGLLSDGNKTPGLSVAVLVGSSLVVACAVKLWRREP